MSYFTYLYRNVITLLIRFPESLWPRLKGAVSKQSRNTIDVIPEVKNSVGNNFEDKILDEGDDNNDDI